MLLWDRRIPLRKQQGPTHSDRPLPIMDAETSVPSLDGAIPSKYQSSEKDAEHQNN
jgi:hypothetical protein